MSIQSAPPHEATWDQREISDVRPLPNIEL